MLFDWSAECLPDDPSLVIPWHDASGQLRFVDLRTDPDALDSIAEAEAHPAMLNALRALNASRSPWFTAKCDAWAASPEEIEEIALNLGIAADEAAAGFVSYIDLLCRDRALFTSFHQQQHLLGRIERRLQPLDQPLALAEAVVRPAMLDLTTPQEGYCVSFYVKSAGPDYEAAYANWAHALAAVIGVLRGRDLLPQT